jgi:CheY-like chemotaxis protein
MAPNETVILLAEDEVIVQNLLRTMLVKEGYAVLTASDGVQAIKICNKFTDAIHLLLTDVQMPNMDGFTLANEVRKQRPEIKVLIMSSDITETILQKNRPDAFLRKPFVPPTLLKCIQRVLANSHTGSCEEV